MSDKEIDNIIVKYERGNNLIEVNPDNISKNLVEMVTKADIMTLEDKKFFVDNTERWSTIQKKCHTWRTKSEKKSILYEYPTTHLKFHQAILENKVFVDETVRLAKDAEIQKLDAEELYADIENIKSEISYLEESKLGLKEDSREYKQIEYQIKKMDIELRKKTVELQEKAYQIQQSAIAMTYRVDELKDWKAFEDEMISEMLAEGYTEDQIWDKDYGQQQGYFFLFLTKFYHSRESKDSGERHNLQYLAKYATDEAIKSGNFEIWVKSCDRLQLESLVELGYIGIREENGKLAILIPEQYKTK